MQIPRRGGRLCALASLAVVVLLLSVTAAEAQKSKDKDGKDRKGGKDSKDKKKSKKEPATLEVTVPEGAREGDKLEFVTPDNQGFYVNVPDGGKEGDKFKLTLPKGVKKARMKKFKVPNWRKKGGSKGKRGSKGSSSKGSKGKPKLLAPIVAIDFGTEYIKIAASIERDSSSEVLDSDPIVLNTQGKRTTPNVVALYEDELSYGDAARSLAQRIPTAFSYVKQMLGQRHQNVTAATVASTMPSGGQAWFSSLGLQYPFIGDLDRNTLRLPIAVPSKDAAAGKFTEVETLGTEELAALLLAHCADLAKAKLSSQLPRGKARGMKPEYIIGVPAHWSKLQRRAIGDAAKLAGFGEKVRLVNEHTGLAFKYALSRNPADVLADKKGKLKGAKGGSMQDSHTALLFDVGSTTATAALVTITLSPKTVGRKVHVAERVNIRSVAFETGVGGLSFDTRLASLLADRYNAAQQEAAEEKASGWFSATSNVSSWDIRTALGGKAMPRLLSSAKKLKEILSANTVIPVNIPSLPAPQPADGVVVAEADLATEVSRAELEALCGDLIDVMLRPVRRVLDETGVTRAEIDAVTIVGGGVRVPLLQEKLKKLLRREQLDTRISGDEAVVEGLAALGAALQKDSSFTRRRDLKITGDRFPHGLMPTADGVVKPLGTEQWGIASAAVGRLTAKAAALAAWQQSISDFEALLFDWDDRLDPTVLESIEEADVADDAEETAADVEAAEGEADPELQAAEAAEQAVNQTSQRAVIADAKLWLEAVAATGGAASVVVHGEDEEGAPKMVPATTEGVISKLAETEMALLDLAPPPPPAPVEPEFDFDKLLDEPDESTGTGADEAGDEAGGGGGGDFDYPDLSEAERQHQVLHTFYGAMGGEKTHDEVAGILLKRAGPAADGDAPSDDFFYDVPALPMATFDELCAKLEAKYGESPAAVWRASLAASSDPSHTDEEAPTGDDFDDDLL